MKNDTIHKISVNNPEEAGMLIYRFLTVEALTNPECTFFSALGRGIREDETMNTYESTRLPSLSQIQRMIASDKTEGVLCVASTDKADLRRVVLSYLPAMGFLALSFPMAYSGLNEKECELLDLLKK